MMHLRRNVWHLGSQLAGEILAARGTMRDALASHGAR